MGADVPRACRAWPINGGSDDRLHTRQGASLCLGGKKGEQRQAIGRSRGGRNTKIHAIADAKGRLLSILLSGGDAHDCPKAQRLIRRTKSATKLLGDKASDSAELREWLHERGTTPIIPNRSNRKQPFTFNSKRTNGAIASRMRSVGSRTCAGSQLDTTDWRGTISLPFVWSPLSFGGFNESEP